MFAFACLIMNVHTCYNNILPFLHLAFIYVSTEVEFYEAKSTNMARKKNNGKANTIPWLQLLSNLQFNMSHISMLPF